MADFPDVDPAAISTLASSLKTVSDSMAGVGLDTEGVRGSVILQSLGINKNTEIWRPDPAFEGKLTASGLARGTIVDSQGSNYMVEVKGTNSGPGHLR
jgi:hypothetical protein